MAISTPFIVTAVFLTTLIVIGWVASKSRNGQSDHNGH